MGDTTEIAWTDRTFNGWLGCQRVSAGCEHCYAERLVTGRMGLKVWGPSQTAPRKRTSQGNWAKPLQWNRAAEKAGVPTRVFCGSLMDWAEDHPMVEPWREELWDLIRKTPWLQWQLLSKRPERFWAVLPADWGLGWRNVWLGVTAENQESANKRIPLLLSAPAVVRFISAEPLLEPLDLRRWLHWLGVNWVIVGGESGPGHRPMDMAWVRSLRRQCKAADVAFFYKQGSAYRPGSDIYLDGQIEREYPDAPKPGGGS